MAQKNLEKLEDDELVALQIDISNKRADAEQDLKAQGNEVQAELDRRDLERRLGDLTPAQEEYLREKLSKKGKEESDG